MSGRVGIIGSRGWSGWWWGSEIRLGWVGSGNTVRFLLAAQFDLNPAITGGGISLIPLLAIGTHAIHAIGIIEAAHGAAKSIRPSGIVVWPPTNLAQVSL